MASALPPAWAELLREETGKPYFKELMAFVEKERQAGPVYPPPEQVFSALALTTPGDVRVLILGQDPYHGPGQAHGLAFSVTPGVATPPSLANMFKELCTDLGCPAPTHGSLLSWASQGVLLLNAVLTVRGGAATSHQGKGWEKFTDAVIQALSDHGKPMVFVLWGTYARKKAKLIDKARHRVLEGTHPSPLSAHGGFFGSKPYSKVNKLLGELGQPPIDWAVPDLPAAEGGPQAAPPRPAKKAKEKAAPAPPSPPPQPPSPDVLALSEALGKDRTPPLDSLLRALKLDAWDRLRRDEREATARAVERLLPRGFTFAGLSPCALGETRHEVAFFTAQDGARFALIPGGSLRLGWDRATLPLSYEQRREWTQALGREKGSSPESWLNQRLTASRLVRLRPFLLEAEPQRRGADYLKGRDKGALSPHGVIAAALAAEGLRLPSSDEWEHGCAAGARSLFPWGDRWPAHLGGDAALLQAPSAFGLHLPADPARPDATDDPDLFRGGDGAGLGKAKGFEGGVYRASSYACDLRALDEEARWLPLLKAATIRRARSILPPDKRQ